LNNHLYLPRPRSAREKQREKVMLHHKQYGKPNIEKRETSQEIKRIQPPHVVIKSKIVIFCFQPAKGLCLYVVEQVVDIIIFMLENSCISFFP